VAWARGRPFSVLICKDALDADVDRILQAVRLHWLYVPSWSAKSDAFARRLPGIAQTITVIANYPGEPGTSADAAIASLPLVRTPLVLERLPDRSPGVLLLQLDDFPLKWQDVR